MFSHVFYKKVILDKFGKLSRVLLMTQFYLQTFTCLNSEWSRTSVIIDNFEYILHLLLLLTLSMHEFAGKCNIAVFVLRMLENFQVECIDVGLSEFLKHIEFLFYNFI